MKIKTRIKLKHFRDGTKVSPSWIVECQHKRLWLPIGDKGRITRYATEQEAQKEADALAQCTHA